MRDVEEPRVFSHGLVLSLDTFVLDRHPPAREWDEARGQGAMFLDEWGFAQSFRHRGGSLGSRGWGFKGESHSQRNGRGVDILRMVPAEVVRLTRGGTVVNTLPLDGRALQVGSDPHGDLVAPDSRIPLHQWLVVPVEGTVRLYDVRRPSRRTSWVPFPRDRLIDVGAAFALSRHAVEGSPAPPAATEVLRQACAEARPVALVHGHGSGARAFRIADRPLSLGTARDNGIVLTDRAVSRVHCRIEPADGEVGVRDLGSTNGTWLDGVRVRRGRLRPGALLRVGRTELRVTAGAASAGHVGLQPVAVSAAMLDVMAAVDRYASLPWPVLVSGETGVGKEVVARLLHERSPRAVGPFVAINAGGLPGPLIESELFGHERGAFTGAVRAHRGAFERADGGTLFLDEIAELPPLLQTRLLRVLETWEIRRVGGETIRSVDVRLVCATHRSLGAHVTEGRFRQDLYYRVHRLSIHVPALRHRVADIEPLARYVLACAPEAIGPKELMPDALSRLRGHGWPGNVRELRNTVERAAAATEGPCIAGDTVDRIVAESPNVALDLDHLQRALAEHRGNVSAAARSLGLPRSTLRDRLRAAGSLDEPEPQAIPSRAAPEDRGGP